MISTETLDRIAGDCKRLGITRLKTVDIEMEFDLERASPTRISEKIVAAPKQNQDVDPKKSELLPQNPEAIAKVETLINTLKLPDDQLLDQIFPAGAGG